MERSFYQEEFEQLIKEKADQYKMYPSSKVWKGIHRSLHSSRKWYWLSFLLFIAGLGYYALEVFTAPPARKSAAENKESSSAVPQQASSEKPAILPFTIVSSAHKVTTVSNLPRIEAPVVPLYPASGSSTPEISAAATETLVAVEESWPVVQENKNNDLPAGLTEPSASIPARLAGGRPSSDLRIGLDKMPAAPTLQAPDEEASAAGSKINWLQEYAIYELAPRKMQRLAWQLSFSPTMNYRKLFGNGNANIGSGLNNVPMAPNIHANIDQLVNHKPAMGFELGSFLLYRVNRNLTLKGGLQFNYSQYDIQAYGSKASEVATISLNNFAGFNPDSITTITRIRNFGGNEQKELRNQYFQLSAPVGLEFLVFGNRAIQFSVAGTIQPTYLMNRNTYLITTDYKNYTHEPSLVRRWNVNTSVEAFISYQAAGLRWQLGPQFRYQLLSTYSDKYPVKEYLMEYGVKLGISKTIR